MSFSVEPIGQRLIGSFVAVQHCLDCFDPPPYAICGLNDFVLADKHRIQRVGGANDRSFKPHHDVANTRAMVMMPIVWTASMN